MKPFLPVCKQSPLYRPFTFNEFRELISQQDAHQLLAYVKAMRQILLDSTAECDAEGTAFVRQTCDAYEYYAQFVLDYKKAQFANTANTMTQPFEMPDHSLADAEFQATVLNFQMLYRQHNLKAYREAKSVFDGKASLKHTLPELYQLVIASNEAHAKLKDLNHPIADEPPRTNWQAADFYNRLVRALNNLNPET